MSSIWRLPTACECNFIADSAVTDKEIFKSLLSGADDIFWTSTPSESDDDLVHVFNMNFGSTSYLEKHISLRSRLVRVSEETRVNTDRFAVSTCGRFITDFASNLDWKVMPQPMPSPWARAMWRNNGINVLNDEPQDLKSLILTIQNALVGRKESLLVDQLIIQVNQLRKS